MLIKWTELIGIINNHDVVLPMCYWASAGPTDQKHFLPFSIFPGVHHMYLHEPCLSVPIETAPSLTEQSMSLCIFYMRACLCSYIHAYVSAYGLLLLTCLLAQRAEKPAGLMWCMRRDGAGLYVCLVMLQEWVPVEKLTRGFRRGDGCFHSDVL